MPGPFGTSVAQAVPFESEPERNNGFISKNVQDAIEEAFKRAVDNDRFQIMCSTSGNAGNGKFLEFFSGNSSDEVPWVVPETLVLKQVTVSTSSMTTAIVKVYKNFNFNVPIATATLNNIRSVIADVPDIEVTRGDAIHVRVENGSIAKPGVYLFFQNT